MWLDELPGSSRMSILQPRGGLFCNYEEENFATTRMTQNWGILGISQVGGVASWLVLTDLK